MLAVTHRKYGTPDVLGIEEVARPVPDADEVLVRVHAAGVSIGAHIITTGKPYLIRLMPFGGIIRPNNLVPGAMFSGRVEAIGARVTEFRAGDEVFGDAGNGAFAEFVVIAAESLAHKPAHLSFEEAAVVPWAMAALQGLRDAGELKAGQRVLINGASGGVGTWAVQLAKVYGAHVTAVCSTRNITMVRELGADEVVDYTKFDFASSGSLYDVVFDTVGNRTLSTYRKVLVPDGIYVACSGGNSGIGYLLGLLNMRITALFTSRKFRGLATAPNGEDLRVLKEIVEANNLRPVIDRRFGFRQVADALSHVGQRRSQGQTVIMLKDETSPG